MAKVQAIDVWEMLVDPNEIENLSVVKSTSASDMGLESEILKA